MCEVFGSFPSADQLSRLVASASAATSKLQFSTFGPSASSTATTTLGTTTSSITKSTSTSKTTSSGSQTSSTSRNTGTNVASSTSTAAAGSGLSTGQKAGLGIGVGLAGALMLAAIIGALLLHKKRKGRDGATLIDRVNILLGRREVSHASRQEAGLLEHGEPAPPSPETGRERVASVVSGPMYALGHPAGPGGIPLIHDFGDDHPTDVAADYPPRPSRRNFRDKTGEAGDAPDPAYLAYRPVEEDSDQIQPATSPWGTELTNEMREIGTPARQLSRRTSAPRDFGNGIHRANTRRKPVPPRVPQQPARDAEAPPDVSPIDEVNPFTAPGDAEADR
ncbi:MAG: hypothetical protein M1824_001886 [Vezdaea acicularis]|nr:MAG: hypothetical protein M1824_001886 [Vezdaea acicularis]